MKFDVLNSYGDYNGEVTIETLNELIDFIDNNGKIVIVSLEEVKENEGYPIHFLLPTDFNNDYAIVIYNDYLE